MKASLTIGQKEYTIDLDKPMSIGIPLNPFEDGPTCFYADQPAATPITSGDFIGRVSDGAPVNFYELHLVPHGNGTHTECIGHISVEFEKVNRLVPNPFFLTELISVKPELMNGDLVITDNLLKDKISQESQALIIRTKPNTGDKKFKNYTETNPPYLTTDAMKLVAELDYKHLLLDLPSVDKEKDEGAVAAHKIFWNFNGEKRLNKTITEMIFVPDEIEDGLYILNLKLSNISLDAVPSEPVLYDVEMIKNVISN